MKLHLLIQNYTCLQTIKTQLIESHFNPRQNRVITYEDTKEKIYIKDMIRKRVGIKMAYVLEIQIIFMKLLC